MKTIITLTLLAAFFTVSILARSGAVHGEHRIGPEKTGILLLAHGGKQNWNEEVIKIAAEVGKQMPVEVAFGMASKRAIQNAADKLVARGVERIVAVPLFVSSHSSVIASTEYLLGQRAEAPAQLARFAKMDHGSDGSSHGNGHGGGHGASHKVDRSSDPTNPLKVPVPIQMTEALNDDPLVAEILLSRAVGMSREPQNEVVVFVAHGPVSDEENALWLKDMRTLTENVRSKTRFKRIEYLTVRDDAPEPIRSRATAEFRSVVERAQSEKSTVLIVPLLLSYGGIEEGIRKRLEGLSYTMSSQALLPDERLATWVIESARRAANQR